jgi:hypothetical protein
MMNWFLAGGVGMFLILAIGVGAIGYGVKAVRDPSAERLAALRGLPALIAAAGVFAFGTDLWAVNRALSNEEMLKAHGIAESQLSVVGLIGLTEAAQALTLAGLLTVIVVGLRVVADARLARRD